jgi:acylphosphatase
MIRAIHHIVSGRVHGVGFRAFVADVARAEGIAGSVKNLPDGRVDVHAEGDAEALARLEWRLWQGPPAARVDDVASEEVVPSGATGFRIV